MIREAATFQTDEPRTSCAGWSGWDYLCFHQINPGPGVRRTRNSRFSLSATENPFPRDRGGTPTRPLRIARREGRVWVVLNCGDKL